MRKFMLKNALGQEFNLMRRDAFFGYPQGLGFEKTKSYQDAGYDWIKTHDLMNQKIISGEMIFRGYRQYSEFVNFCYQEPLTLCYKPHDKWHYIGCELRQLAKSEIGRDTALLSCPVEFVCDGTWYDSITLSKSVAEVDGGKRYPYKYNYRYADGAVGTVRIVNNGKLDSPAILYIYGPCSTPQWTLAKTGATVASGRINGAVGQGEVLYVNSRPKDMQISILDAGTLEFSRSVYGQSDFSTARFVYAPPGESVITFSHLGSAPIVAIVEVMQLAATV